MTGNSRKLPDEELCDWGSSDNIIRIRESWSTEWVEHVAQNQTKPKKTWATSKLWIHFWPDKPEE